MMAKHIDDIFHAMAALALSGKYTTHADARQKAMGLSYITAEKEDLNREVAALMRQVFHAGRKDLLIALDKIGYAPPEGPAGPTLPECIKIAREALALAEVCDA